MTYTIAKLFLILNFALVVASCDKKTTTPDDTAARPTPPSGLITQKDAGLDSKAVYNVIKDRKDLTNDVLAKIMKSVAQAIKGNTVNEKAREAAIVKAVKDNGGDDKLASAIKILVNKEYPIGPGLDDQETVGAATYALFADAAAANAKDILALNELLKKVKPIVALDTKAKRDAAIDALKIDAAGVAGVTAAKIKTAMEIDRLGLVKGGLGDKTFELFTNAATAATATTAIVDALKAHLVLVKTIYDTTYATTGDRDRAINTMAIPAGSTVAAADIKRFMDQDKPISGGSDGLDASTGIPRGDAGATYGLFIARKNVGADVAALNALLAKIKPSVYDDATHFTQQARGLAIDAVADIANAATAAGITLVQIKTALNTDRPLRVGLENLEATTPPLGPVTSALFTVPAASATDDATITTLNGFLRAVKGIVSAPAGTYATLALRNDAVAAAIPVGSIVDAAQVNNALNQPGESPFGVTVLKGPGRLDLNTHGLFQRSHAANNARVFKLNDLYDLIEPIYAQDHDNLAAREALLNAPGIAAAFAAVPAAGADSFDLVALKTVMQTNKPLLIAQADVAGGISNELYDRFQRRAISHRGEAGQLNLLLPQITAAVAIRGPGDSKPARDTRIGRLVPPIAGFFNDLIQYLDDALLAAGTPLDTDELLRPVGMTDDLYDFFMALNAPGLRNAQRNLIMANLQVAIVGPHREPSAARNRFITDQVNAAFNPAAPPAGLDGTISAGVDNLYRAVPEVIPAGMDNTIIDAIRDPLKGDRTQTHLNAIMAVIAGATAADPADAVALANRATLIRDAVRDNGGAGVGGAAAAVLADTNYADPIINTVNVAHPVPLTPATADLDPTVHAAVSGVAAASTTKVKNTLLRAIRDAVNVADPAQRLADIQVALNAANLNPGTAVAINGTLETKYYPFAGAIQSFVASGIPYAAYDVIRDSARIPANIDAIITGVREAINLRPRYVDNATRGGVITAAIAAAGGASAGGVLEANVNAAVDAAHDIEAAILAENDVGVRLDGPAYTGIHAVIISDAKASNTQMNAMLMLAKAAIDGPHANPAARNVALDDAVDNAIAVGNPLVAADADAWKLAVRDAVADAAVAPVAGRPAWMDVNIYNDIIGTGGISNGQKNRIMTAVQAAIDTLPRKKDDYVNAAGLAVLGRDSLLNGAARSGLFGLVNNNLRDTIKGRANGIHPELDPPGALTVAAYNWITANVANVGKTNLLMNNLINELDGHLSAVPPTLPLMNGVAVRAFFNNDINAIGNYLRGIHRAHPPVAVVGVFQGTVTQAYDTGAGGNGFVVTITVAGPGAAVGDRVFLPIAMRGNLPWIVGDTVHFNGITGAAQPNHVPALLPAVLGGGVAPVGRSPAKLVNAPIVNYIVP